VAQALNPQGGLYTLALLDAQTRYRVIGSVGNVLTGAEPRRSSPRWPAPTRASSARPSPKKAIAWAAMASSIPRIPPRRSGQGPRGWLGAASFTGWLVQGLSAPPRRATGVTVLSCDNLTDNGRKLEAATLALARELDPDTAAWMADHVRFPMPWSI
jgi:fructuronate reductase